MMLVMYYDVCKAEHVCVTEPLTAHDSKAVAAKNQTSKEIREKQTGINRNESKTKL